VDSYEKRLNALIDEADQESPIGLNILKQRLEKALARINKILETRRKAGDQ
jgi:hypothetical protein